MKVDHNGPLLVVNLGSVDIQVQTVLVSDGGASSNIKLRAHIAVVCSIILFSEWFDFYWRLLKKSMTIRHLVWQSIFVYYVAIVCIDKLEGFFTFFVPLLHTIHFYKKLYLFDNSNRSIPVLKMISTY